jgi:catalase
MLQSRLFSYDDAQPYRLGVKHQLIPVISPRCPVHSYYRDGMMRVADNAGSTFVYDSNSYGEWGEHPEFSEPPLDLEGNGRQLKTPRGQKNYCAQPDLLFRLISPEQQAVLFGNTARAMGDATHHVKSCYIGNCLKADPAYGKGGTDALGIPLNEVG